MKNPSAAEGSGSAVPEHDRQPNAGLDAGPSGERTGSSMPADLQAVDEGIALLGRYEEAVTELLAGVSNLPMPGR